jgi:hypothetical protein
MFQEDPAMRPPRVRFTIQRMMIGVAGASALLAGYTTGGVTGGLRLLLSPDIMPSPSSMDLLRFGTFVAWLVTVFLFAASDLACTWTSAGSDSHRARGIKRFILTATAVTCVLTAVLTVVVVAINRQSKGFADRASKYYDLCVDHSSKAHPALKGDLSATAKCEYYDKLWRKYQSASERPWAPVDPDPPEPK